MMQTCSLFFGVLRSVAIFCTPTPDEVGWKTGDYIALASAIATAVGVFTALGAAIMVPYFQTKHLAAEGVAKERSEIRSFLRAIRAEVSVTWANYGRMRPDWDRLQPGDFVRQIFLFSDKSFSIYDNAGGNIGNVPDIKLQEGIVGTYGLAKSLILTFRLNNAMLQDLRVLEALPLDGETHMPMQRAKEIEKIKGNLKSQAERLRELDSALKERVDELLAKIDDFLGQSS